MTDEINFALTLVSIKINLKFINKIVYQLYIELFLGRHADQTYLTALCTLYMWALLPYTLEEGKARRP